MNSPFRATTRASLLVGVLLFLGSLPGYAFPPAPHHRIFGTIRDERGNPLQPGSAQVILETSSQVRHSAPIGRHGAGVNYQLAVPMDAGITSKLYQPTALRPFVSFKIKVRIGSEIYLPIEMVSDYSHLGEPGQDTRIDLTLGIDSDGDGLPDAWEQAVLSKTGGQGLKAVNPSGDLDGDGLSNLNEYLAGTYAFDPKDGFSLKIAQTQGTSSVLEFVTVRGRSYSILASHNMRDWTPVSFWLPGDPADARARDTFQAVTVTLIRAAVAAPVEGQPARFFKLMIQ